MNDGAPNKICFNINCQKEYFCCLSCEQLNSWRRVACSPECFQAYMAMLDEQEKLREKD